MVLLAPQVIIVDVCHRSSLSCPWSLSSITAVEVLAVVAIIIVPLLRVRWCGNVVVAAWSVIEVEVVASAVVARDH